MFLQHKEKKFFYKQVAARFCYTKWKENTISLVKWDVVVKTPTLIWTTFTLLILSKPAGLLAPGVMVTYKICWKHISFSSPLSDVPEVARGEFYFCLEIITAVGGVSKHSICFVHPCAALNCLWGGFQPGYGTAQFPPPRKLQFASFPRNRVLWHTASQVGLALRSSNILIQHG